MNIVIITIGSRGDVQPYIALGQGLKECGHSVTLCTSVCFEDVIKNSGLHYGYVNNKMIDFIHSNEGRSLIENTSNFFQLLKVYFRVFKKIKPMQKSLIDDSWASTKRANPDLILFHPKALGAIHFAEKLKIPVILCLLQPVYVSTQAFPCAAFKPREIGGWYNRFTYAFIRTLSAFGTKRLTRIWRQENSLPDKHKSTSQLINCAGQPIPVLHAFSQYVVPRPQDWPTDAHLTGYWFTRHDNDWQPPEQWEEFLDTDEPVVYVGFGSMAGNQPDWLGSIVLEALKLAKVRAVIASGWGGLEFDQLPDRVLHIDHAPHEWLFVKMKAIIHHGGAGTTAAALRAGCPSIICPFIVDQPFWGWRIHKLGLGSQPIEQKKLNPQHLAQAIKFVTTNEDIQRNVKAISHKINSEQGVANAIELIGRYSKPLLK